MQVMHVFVMQVQSTKGRGVLPVGYVEISLNLHNQSCLTFIPIIVTHLLYACFVFFPHGSIQSSPDIVISVICKLTYVTPLTLQLAEDAPLPSFSLVPRMSR